MRLLRRRLDRLTSLCPLPAAPHLYLAERAAFLAGVCGGGAEKLQRIESLLHWHNVSGNSPGATAERQDSETTTFLLSSPQSAFIVSQYANPRSAARRG
jgi:hypothetical protein